METVTASRSTLVGWHWLRDDRLLQHSRSKKQIKPGSVTAVKGPLELCAKGLHASERAIDSLEYAPGPILCRVELSGEILRGDDKACATQRRVLWMVDATRTLHEFAVWCARRALERERAAGREPDPRSWAALDAKVKWLNGEITEQELAAAGDAARAAAWAAAGAAAWDAAWAAAGDAARAAAWDAARAAAWDAARAAAEAAAWAAGDARAAEREAQNDELTQQLMTLRLA